MRLNSRLLILAATFATLTGCAAVVQRAADGLSTGLTQGISNHDDVDTVAAGLPAYLLLLDGLIERDSRNPVLLLSAAKLYGTYAGGFVADAGRVKRLSDRSFAYAKRGICARDESFCRQFDDPDFDRFNTFVGEHVGRDDVDAAYVLASSWIGWLRADTADYSRIADLPRIETLLNRVNALHRRKITAVRSPISVCSIACVRSRWVASRSVANSACKPPTPSMPGRICCRRC
ncbi:MAG: hypothetical protein IPH50_00990 [Rhodanobacteraceae bacterium]|nr:hypothetical protein [Rhodanobacteraceae bacterium]